MNNRKMIFGAILSVLACFVLLPQMRAASDNPEAFVGSNTFDGFRALFSQTANGFNSAFGWQALLLSTTALNNTGIGAGALALTNTSNNTALGAGAGTFNTGANVNAVGAFALFNNGASFNNAHGRQALFNNTTGNENEAFGDLALLACTTGSMNTAMGDDALISLSTANSNVAVGKEAGNAVTTGSGNTFIGANAGDGATTTLTGNIYVGVRAGVGVGNEVAFIRIGEVSPPVVYDTFIKGIFARAVQAGALPVFVDSAGKLGTIVSSRRYKHDIKPMDKASEAILALKPVTYHYNRDDMNEAQFGLVAEDVEAVNPDLVVYDECGEPLSVRYDAVNAMLLNEFLKEHKRVEEQQASISQLKSEMQTMVAQLKEQAVQIQKVSAQLEVRKTAPQVVANKP